MAETPPGSSERIFPLCSLYYDSDSGLSFPSITAKCHTLKIRVDVTFKKIRHIKGTSMSSKNAMESSINLTGSQWTFKVLVQSMHYLSSFGVGGRDEGNFRDKHWFLMTSKSDLQSSITLVFPGSDSDHWSCSNESVPHLSQEIIPTHLSYIEQEQKVRVRIGYWRGNIRPTPVTYSAPCWLRCHINF